ncbi:MAG: hypothetical protein RL033_8109 [Pseudomonadota bacterium]
MIVHAGSTPSAEEVDRFLGMRVAAYAKLLMLMMGGLYVVGVGIALIWLRGQFLAIHLHPAKLLHIGLIVVAASAWQLTRRPSCPRWAIGAVDVLLPLSLNGTVCAVAASAPPLSGLFLGPLLISALVLMLRAALVPSSPRQTALVSAASGVPTVLAAYLLASGDVGLTAPLTPNMVTAGVACWALALTGATSKISAVIYGLHREVVRARRLGPYVLGEKIGEGGMGAVYRAEHSLLKRPAAVKLLLPERAGPESIARFEREVQLTARLAHPNTVAVYDYGHTPDGLFYYAMELLDGLSLEALVERYGPQPPGRVIHILAQAAGALAEAHALGLIHRDVKPANILFCDRGGLPDVVKLVDFGLVKNLDTTDAPALTQANSIAGTPLYLSPEAITDAARLDHRADLYGLGGVAYYLLTGTPPFPGKHLIEICGQHLHGVPQRPSQRLGRAMPEELEQLVLECLAKKPEQRPRDATALQERLLACGGEQSWTMVEARAWWRQHAARSSAGSARGPLRP